VTMNFDTFKYYFRQGHLCGRCMRNVNSVGHDELSMMLDHEEEEDASIVNSVVSETHRSMIMLQIQVQKRHMTYFAMLKKQQLKWKWS
jgi:hypothetical protein